MANKKIALHRRIVRKIGGRFLARLVLMALRAIFFTCRYRFINKAQFKERAAKGGFILAMWHNRIGMVVPFLCKHASPEGTYTVVVSQDRDGDLVVDVAAKYQRYANIIRVPKKQRHLTPKKMIQALNNNEVLLVAVDGSRGPRYQVKPGVAFTARAANVPIVPFTYSCSRFWQLSTWDGFMIPKPFSKITFGVGEPIILEAKSTTERSDDTELVRQAILKLDREMDNNI